MYGKHHDEATRQKISQAQKGRQFIEEYKEKLKLARRAYLEKQKAALKV